MNNEVQKSNSISDFYKLLEKISDDMHLPDNPHLISSVDKSDL